MGTYDEGGAICQPRWSLLLQIDQTHALPAVWEGGSVNETAGPIRLQRAAEQPKQIAAASIFELLDYQEHGEFVSSSIDRALVQSNSPRGISYDCDTVD